MDQQSNFKLMTIGDIRGNFFVPTYQRGYRWGKDNITRLLDDIKDFLNETESNDSKYCLQPVVVKGRENDDFELIDGQQRLTTIFLILIILDDNPEFSMSYETRKETEKILDDLRDREKEKNEPSAKSQNLLEQYLKEKKNECIDSWFICEAYEKISKWLEENIDLKEKIRKGLKERVNIIWYEIGNKDSDESIKFFERLNTGRIPLTNSELVKALFFRENGIKKLNEDGNNGYGEVLRQWEKIEESFRNDDFWYFISGNNEYQTRIDLLLDLIATSDTRETYSTFFYFYEQSHSKSLSEIWKCIYETFCIIQFWFNDYTLYNRVGFLIDAGHKVKDLVKDWNEKKSKNEFKKSLNKKIKNFFEVEDDEDLNLVLDDLKERLSYEGKDSEKKKLNLLLLLFNIATMEKENTYNNSLKRFRFTDYKKSNWSLEHIHAQNSEKVRTWDARKEWIERHEIFLAELIKNKILFDKYTHDKQKRIIDIDDKFKEKLECFNETQNSSEAKKIINEEFDNLYNEFIYAVYDGAQPDWIHKIPNLALLKKENNSAINNSVFYVKRSMILDLKKNGEYVPICTLNVFEKVYNRCEDSESEQFFFWDCKLGGRDGEHYFNALKNDVVKYLTD